MTSSLNSPFKSVGLIGRQRSPQSIECIQSLCGLLAKLNCDIYIEEETASFISDSFHPILDKTEFGKQTDLVIVVGGDGSLLNAARLVVEHNTPVLGINRGRLGFLTDIRPTDIEKQVTAVLQGHYLEEQRFLLEADVIHQQQSIHSDIALNEVVLLPGQFTHMIEFEIYIDKQFVCAHRADGHIIATPTGSTAYSLSGGGPILHPELEAMVMVPMFSHNLSSRPVVISNQAVIDIITIPRFETAPQMSCDGQTRVPVAAGDVLHIRKHPHYLRLLHPRDYNYFETLRTKLHWEQKLT